MRMLLAWFAVAWLALPCLTRAQANLRDGFVHPPAEARPWVYWFWMDGNLSREGITADLEAMRGAGIGGVLIMEVDVGIPRGPVRFMSPEWRGLFKHAVTEAERLGLEITLNAGPGWTGSGGPWVKPEQSMQHLVASETVVSGPLAFEGALAQPAPREPYFKGVVLPAELEQAKNAFYRDVAVLAVPVSEQAPALADIDEKALYLRHPYSSMPNVKPYFPVLSQYAETGPGIATAKIVDLTGRLRDGRLSWTVPPGKWAILRFGRTSTGANTRPAPLPGLGLECDKFDRAALDAHFKEFVETLVAEIGPRPADRTAGWTSLHIDSWEMGSQNWTAAFRDEFRRRRGYDPLPYLPVYLGHVVESVEQSERFLWDVRQTSQDLVIENHAQHLKVLGRKHGLKLSIEPYDLNPCADLTLGGVADVPMCEFWSLGMGFETSFSCFEAASIAHVLGRPIVAAEAFTALPKEAWQLHPGAMKNQADWALAVGINRFVFHRYAHQPWLDRQPGMTMGPYGIHFERTQTWWSMVGAWNQYLARCQHVLRQGLPVADVCYLTAEGAPHVFRPPSSALAGKAGLSDRRGYNFDGCSPESLAQMTVRDGRLTTPQGVGYRLLVLPQAETMTPQLLVRVKQLVEQGATVVGPRPRKSPSLTDYPRCDEEVARLAEQLWGPAESWPTSVRKVGQGRIVEIPRYSAAIPAPPREAVPANAAWIWHAEGGRPWSAPPGARVFRRVFDLPADANPSGGRLLMTADNAFEAQVNGVVVGEGNNFQQVQLLDVGGALRPGHNEIVVTAVNGGDAPNPAGLLGALLVPRVNGSVWQLVTDDVWECRAGQKEPWQKAVMLGPSGIKPWGTLNPAQGKLVVPELYCHYDRTAGLLAADGVPPDFEADVPLRYLHRADGDYQVYFMSNPGPDTIEAKCRFRVALSAAEIWNPVTGRIASTPSRSTSDGRQEVTLALEPFGSRFVVFRAGAVAKAPPQAANTTTSALAKIEGPWQVSFQPNRGAPKQIDMATLADWSQMADTGVQHFSGVATYRTKFNLPAGAIGQEAGGLWLDLGRVEVMARVRLNGHDLGVVWKTPFAVDVVAAARAGENELEVEVANLWPNRLIGDASLPVEKRVAWTTWNPYNKSSLLLPSGLLGPVVVRRPGAADLP